MAGLQSGAPSPQDLTVHNQSRVLEISFSDGKQFRIPPRRVLPKPFSAREVLALAAEVIGPDTKASAA